MVMSGDSKAVGPSIVVLLIYFVLQCLSFVGFWQLLMLLECIFVLYFSSFAEKVGKLNKVLQRYFHYSFKLIKAQKQTNSNSIFGECRFIPFCHWYRSRSGG